MPKAKDLTGLKFGRWVVARYANHRGSHRYWLCKCACGTEKQIQTSNLTSGASTSCGCYKAERLSLQKLGKVLSPLEVAHRALFSHYKDSAKRRNLEFSLTREQVSDLTTKPCVYCGKEPYLEMQAERRKLAIQKFLYNTIDRIDSRKGYVVDNCVSCCRFCNQAKMAMTVEEFLMWVESVYNHSIYKSLTEVA